MFSRTEKQIEQGMWLEMGNQETLKDDRREGRIRRVPGNVLIVIALLLTAYLCLIMPQRIDAVVLKDTYRTVFHDELVGCSVLFLFSLDVRFGLLTKLRPKLLRILGRILRFLAAVLLTAAMVLSCKVVAGGMINTAEEAQYVIVLGMALEHGKPSRDLIFRVNTAQQYSQDHPSAVLILTGGNPDGSDRSESEVMRQMLIDRGIPEDRMILEEQSATTRENLINSAQFLDLSEPVVLISSNYHMDRAARIAREAGYQECLRLPAPSDPVRYASNVIWEVLMDINDMMTVR